MPAEELDAIWSPMHLERLARTYWKYLSRVTLGLIRVVYTPTERAVVLLVRPFVLLRFHAPEYEMDDVRGIVRWKIRSGILVAAQGHDGDGYLEIDVRRSPADQAGRARMHVEVEIASFYPALAFRGARWIYANTQSRIHVLVTHGFLRSLARLELEESAVGRFAPHANGDDAGGPARQRRRHPVAGGRGARRGPGGGARARHPPAYPVSPRSFSRSWRDWIRRTVPERERITSDSVLAPREPS